jgi:hypothetical protein
VPEEEKSEVPSLEVEVHLAQEFKEDVEVDFQVGGVISELGCSRTKNCKFSHTLELYWHVKTMVSFRMLPKDEDFHQLKRRMEMLESQNEYLLKVVTWLSRKHIDIFQPPAVGSCFDASYVGPRFGVSSVGLGLSASSARINNPLKSEPQVLKAP